MILLWTMHNLLAYGIVVGCAIKGFQGCPICGPSAVTQRSQTLRKNVYGAQQRKWLPMEHVFQQATTSFDGVREDGVPPQRMTFDEIHSVVVAQTTWLVNGG